MAAPKGNKFAVGANGGRPPHYKTPEEMQAAFDEYFIYIEGEKKIVKQTVKDDVLGEYQEDLEEWVRYPEPATITGLTLYIGFSGLASYNDYMKKSDEFSNIIKRAKARVALAYEHRLHGTAPTGAIFALKNMGWKDKTDHEMTGANGSPLHPVTDFSKYTDAELITLAELQRKGRTGAQAAD